MSKTHNISLTRLLKAIINRTNVPSGNGIISALISLKRTLHESMITIENAINSGIYKGFDIYHTTPIESCTLKTNIVNIISIDLLHQNTFVNDHVFSIFYVRNTPRGHENTSVHLHLNMSSQFDFLVTMDFAEYILRYYFKDTISEDELNSILLEVII